MPAAPAAGHTPRAGMPGAGGAAPLGFLMIFTAATCPVVLFVHSLTFAKCPEPSSFPRSLHTGVVGVMRVFASESLGVGVWHQSRWVVDRQGLPL